MKRKISTNNNVERIVAEPNVGLTSAAVQKRIACGADNKVKTNTSKSYFKIFQSNICTFFNLLCVICFIALVAVGAQLSDYIFVVIYAANTIISIFQEIRAKRTIEKLSLVSAPTATVIRDGQETEIAIADVVLDDILVLKLGAQIPADAVLVDGQVEVNESMLTGESVPVKKTCGSPLFSGSFVVGGSCRCRVEKVGDESYIQTLSIKAKAQQRPESRLLSTMNTIIKTVGILIFPIAAVMGFINFKALSATLVGNALVQAVVTQTASVIIGMIPAGMFLLTTMALAVGVIKLAKLNTLTQDMYALEMLARADCLCLDKTGTITDGQMLVKDIIEYQKLKSLTAKDAIYSLEKALGDTNLTALALIDYCKSDVTLNAAKIVPFSSARKYSAAYFEGHGTFLLGASTYLIKKLPKTIEEDINDNMKLGRRVLLLAVSPSIIREEEIPEDISPIALIVLEDNIRKEAIETIKWFRKNDVAVKVISGDDPMTVSEISRRAGIENADKYVNLYGLSDDEVAAIANKYTVFGRVSPEQKAILVKALKANGHTVAMTGDGVNDILAMKVADCSITVASGSAATRNIAHLVLLDNNFNSLPRVVAEGRRVINNVQQSSSLYLMKTLFTMIFALVSIITATQYPFTPRMMLMLEMMIIGLPSFALSLQPNDKRAEGSFIIRALSNALPGTLILMLNIYGSQAAAMLLGLNLQSDVFQTVLVVMLTFGGWAYLINLCIPLNKYRGALVALISAIMLVWFFFLLDSSFFSLAPLFPINGTGAYLLIIVVIFALDFLLLRLFGALFRFADKKLHQYDYSD